MFILNPLPTAMTVPKCMIINEHILIIHTIYNVNNCYQNVYLYGFYYFLIASGPLES